jgi:hypothetical protein
MPKSNDGSVSPTDDAPKERDNQTESHESTRSRDQQADPAPAAIDDTIEPEWENIVDLTSDDSFPASDPPMWATGQKRTRRDT